MSGGEQKFNGGKDHDEAVEEVTLKEKLENIYDWFGWHGVAPLGLVLMGAFCVVVGSGAFGKHLKNLNLQGDIERNRISNEHTATVTMDESNHVVAIDDIYYQGVCELNSVSFDADGDTCYYHCWWKGDIGAHPRYSMTLPCKAK